MNKLRKPDDLDNFDAWGAYLRRVVKRARDAERKENSLSPINTEYGALRASAYGYLFKLNEAQLMDKLEAHIRASGAFGRGPPVTGARWVFQLMELKPVGQESSKRTRIAQELDFALRHNVDPDLVLGFLYEVGSQKTILREGKSKRAPEPARRYRAR